MSGKTLGTKEKMDPYLALQAFTSNAAYVYREENAKGKILPGMLADLVELDQNPLTIDPDAIKDIKVVNTIKNGKVIYSRNAE
jgi:predicted amidohydrolase YtcJ